MTIQLYAIPGTNRIAFVTDSKMLPVGDWRLRNSGVHLASEATAWLRRDVVVLGWLQWAG